VCDSARIPRPDDGDGSAKKTPVIIDLTEFCTARRRTRDENSRSREWKRDGDVNCDEGGNASGVGSNGSRSRKEVDRIAIGSSMESHRSRKRRLANRSGANLADESADAARFKSRNFGSDEVGVNNGKSNNGGGGGGDSGEIDFGKKDNFENAKNNGNATKSSEVRIVSNVSTTVPRKRQKCFVTLEEHDDDDEIDFKSEPPPKKQLPFFANCANEQNEQNIRQNPPRHQVIPSNQILKGHRGTNSIPEIQNGAVQNYSHRAQDDERITEHLSRNDDCLHDSNGIPSWKHSNAIKISHTFLARRTSHSNQGSKSQDNNAEKKTAPFMADFFKKHPQQPYPPENIDALMQEAKHILLHTFGHTSLRPLQANAVQTALQRKSQIIVMATGGGKSLCYQIPALVNGGSGNNNSNGVSSGNNALSHGTHVENSRVTIVICPLVALMVDQTNNLHKRGVMTAACLSSSVSAKTKAEIYRRLQLDNATKKKEAKGKGKNATMQPEDLLTPIHLLYVTPELLETDRFRTVLTKLDALDRLNMFAVDEAHCLSTWGHDFRPAYRKLTWLRETFPSVPVMACTGTATAKVIDDIREILCLDSKKVPCIMGTFNRENISYEVRFKDSLNAKKPQGAMKDLVAVVKEHHEKAKKANEPCSGIIYVHKREDCTALATQITKATGLMAAPYHAGLKDSERVETQRKWSDGTICIAVATVAFGMGIDLPHVRYVCHWTMAKSLEGFYQESGRGGRDGKPSLSILYYSKDDASKFAFLVRKNAERVAQKKGKLDGSSSQKVDHSLLELEGMVDYCTKPGCKRKYVLNHFGEKIDAESVCKNTCDYCRDPMKVQRAIKASECMSSVVNSYHATRAGNTGRSKSADMFNHNPLASDESQDEYESDYYWGGDGELFGYSEFDQIEEKPTKPTQKGFVKASKVLNKYEMKECQTGKKGGFVNFKTRTFEQTDEDKEARRLRPVELPEHLRKNMPDPLAEAYKKKNDTGCDVDAKPSAAYASEAERLKAELEALKKEKTAFLEKMNQSGSSGPSKPLSAPSLSFRKRR